MGKKYLSIMLTGLLFWTSALVAVPKSEPLIGLDILEEILFSNNFELTDEGFKGEFKDSKKWDGFLCDGKQSYKANVKGAIDAIDFELLEKGEIDARADLGKIFGRVSGSYKSVYSGCVKLSGTFPFEIDSLKVMARANFVEGEDGEPVLKLKITKTHFGRIRFTSLHLPGFMEKSLTRFTNSAMKYVWKSRLGGWLSEKISEKIGKELPFNHV